MYWKQGYFIFLYSGQISGKLYPMIKNTIASLKEYQNQLSQELREAREQLAVSTNMPGQVFLKKQVEGMEKNLDSLLETIRELEHAESEMEKKQRELESEKQSLEDHKRKLGPGFSFFEEQRKIEAERAEMEEEKLKLEGEHEALKEDLRKVAANQQLQNELRKEIRLWGQILLVFGVILTGIFLARLLVPDQYITVITLSLSIFLLFPLVGLAITTYNIYRY